MCGIYSNPYETARSLTVAAAPKIVVNQTGKTIEESNIELAKQMALVYKTLLRELQREEEEVEQAHSHEHEHDHDHPHTHEHDHDHDHGHTHDHGHSH